MNHQLYTQDSFFVAGIAVRTINLNGRAAEDIGKLWQRFHPENIGGQISNKYSDDIYCVYTDYETDHTGWYTAVLGFRVSEIINDGFFVALVPSGNYRVYNSEGKIPESVGETWMQIWRESDSRSYVADYDLYKTGAGNFKDAEVEIYVGYNKNNYL